MFCPSVQQLHIQLGEHGKEDHSYLSICDGTAAFFFFFLIVVAFVLIDLSTNVIFKEVNTYASFIAFLYTLKLF